MTQKLKWSIFIVRTKISNNNILLKQLQTGAIVSINQSMEQRINEYLNGNTKSYCHDIELLAKPQIRILIDINDDEHKIWMESFLSNRETKKLFVVHFLPTLNCQMECKYCFEKGNRKMGNLSKEILSQTEKWLHAYISKHKEIDALRMVLFGGEPLLNKSMVKNGVDLFHQISRNHNLNFWCELVTNGELLDEKMCGFLSHHNWHRVQITVDGAKTIHDSRRYGKNHKPTFDKIFKVVDKLSTQEYPQFIDLRISFDEQTVQTVDDLMIRLAEINNKDRIRLSLGFITPTFEQQGKRTNEINLAEKALLFWKSAKSHGFAIPDKFITGPWCVAISKHSAVIQPDGSIQKCFCTVGRSKFNFGNIFQMNEWYLQDKRFEYFDRIQQCIMEKCPYISICGGGCIHDAIVAYGIENGHTKRFCQKNLIKTMNEGLLLLNS